MTANRSQTGKQRYPSLQGRVIYDTYRGQQRVRSWPRPRGPSPLEQQQIQTEWFKAANLLAVKAAPSQMAVAVESTRNLGLYPRDVIIRAMGAGLIDIIEPDGSLIQYRQDRLDKVIFQGAVLELDVDQAIPANTVTTVSFPLPVIDTASFWDVTSPGRLTIPEGVTLVEVGCRTLQLTTKTGQLILLLNWNGIEFARQAIGGTMWHGEVLKTGPLPVVEGDYFQFKLFMGYTGGVAVAAGKKTGFNINVLGTI